MSAIIERWRLFERADGTVGEFKLTVAGQEVVLTEDEIDDVVRELVRIDLALPTDYCENCDKCYDCDIPDKCSDCDRPSPKYIAEWISSNLDDIADAVTEGAAKAIKTFLNDNVCFLRGRL